MSLGARSQIFLPCVELSRQSQEQGEREREKDKQRECHIGSEAKVVSERNTQSLSLWSVCVGSTWWREGRKFVTVTAYPSLSISYPFSSWKALCFVHLSLICSIITTHEAWGADPIPQRGRNDGSSGQGRCVAAASGEGSAPWRRFLRLQLSSLGYFLSLSLYVYIALCPYMLYTFTYSSNASSKFQQGMIIESILR